MSLNWNYNNNDNKKSNNKTNTTFVEQRDEVITFQLPTAAMYLFAEQLYVVLASARMLNMLNCVFKWCITFVKIFEHGYSRRPERIHQTKLCEWKWIALSTIYT